MATRYHIGAKELRGELSAYAKRFDMLEVRPPSAAQPKVGPTLTTLRKWRKAAPPHFEFVVVLGPAVGRLKASPELESELETALAAATALQSRCILLATPAEVTPTALSRDRIARLLERLPRDVTQIAWEPRGVWETDDAAVWACKWGVALSVDPTREPVPAGPVAYARLRALGESRSFGPAALERVTQAIGDRREAYVVIDSPTALAECKKLRQLSQRTAAKDGGRGRVIRPRNLTLKVRDDEQE
ncbi:MAG: DUF72 domain-containing protein [Myxococcales bacterium]|jgi:uncharacterized protein YecE (DUF72 family)|nr:DUF72 domain-containing protein [Myxococcales bacterium]MBL0193927.1 DUF72 domain-containing protein [Myxococcales bacterium]HQY61796.1 DUF72 domain-containing protein [Polyangiaceae bacterium]